MRSIFFCLGILMLSVMVCGCDDILEGSNEDNYDDQPNVIVASGVEYKLIIVKMSDGTPTVEVMVTNHTDTPICKVSLTATAYSKEFIDFAFVYFGENEESGKIDPGQSATGIAKFPDLEEIEYAEIDGGWVNCAN